MSEKKVLFVYTSQGHTGLSNKAKKIEQGFRDEGCFVDAVYLGVSRGRLRRVADMLSIYARVAVKLIFGHHDLVFMRYAYFFFPLYLLAAIMRKNFQVEVNSNVSKEFSLRGQKIRKFIDSYVMAFVRVFAKRIHVASKSLVNELKLDHPGGNYVFTSNFVVDENYQRISKPKNEKINLVFMGNTAQKWHGIPLFLDVILSGDISWFRSSCTLHFLGNVDVDTKAAIERNQLNECVHLHGHLSGEEKHKVLGMMDLGLNGFNLKILSMKNTTGIKIGEYLHNGIGLIIGYEDPVVPSTLPFVLSLDLYGDAAREREKFSEFVKQYRGMPNATEVTHDFAKENLLVNRYIGNIISDFL